MNADNDWVRPLNVLLVEDHEADVVLTLEALEEAKVLVDIGVAKDGQAALEILEAAQRHERPKPELILLDLNLPKVDGLDVLEWIKTHPETRRIPVVVLTSSKSPADIKGAYERHANSVIAKPIDPQEFLSSVKGLKDYWVTIVRLPSRL